MTKAQPIPRAVVRAKPGPRAVTKAQPVAPSATTRAQPVVHSAVVKAQPVHNAMTRAHLKKATSVQPSSAMHQTVRSNVGNMKGITSKTSSCTVPGNHNSSRITIFEDTLSESGMHFVKSILEVCNVEPVMSGEYSCTSQNEFGSETARFQLSVFDDGKPI